MLMVELDWMLCRRAPAEKGEATTGDQTGKSKGDDTAPGRGLEDIGEKVAGVGIVGCAFDKAEQTYEQSGDDAGSGSG
jgi:hypothetical protein